MAVAREKVEGGEAAREPEGAVPDDDVIALLGARELERARRLLMQRHGTAVYRYCRAELQDPSLAADAHEQVFVEAFRELPRLESAGTLRVWLFTIARRCVLAAVQIGGRPVPDPLASAVAELTSAGRAAVLLHYQQGFTFAQISKICGETVEVLQDRVKRALPKLRELVESRSCGSTR